MIACVTHLAKLARFPRKLAGKVSQQRAEKSPNASRTFHGKVRVYFRLDSSVSPQQRQDGSQLRSRSIRYNGEASTAPDWSLKKMSSELGRAQDERVEWVEDGGRGSSANGSTEETGGESEYEGEDGVKLIQTPEYLGSDMAD